MQDIIRTCKIKEILSISTALAGIAAPQLAAAQTEQGDAINDAELILVTARRQSESLQDVPLTVSVISAKTLETFQVNEVADLQSRIPAFNVQVGGSGSGGQLSLRGVGSSNISAAFDSAVAFNFDGVIINTMRFVQAGFFDTAQVEVLKGPQSLFFGKSASAGVLSIQSNDPGDELEVIGRASYEFEERGYLVEGIISAPLTDTLGVRFAAQYNDISEFAELQPGTPAQNQTRGWQNLILRGTIDWAAHERLQVNLKANYLQLRTDGALMTSEIDCGANGVADPVFLLSGAVTIPAAYDCNAQDQLYAHADPSSTLVGSIPEEDPLSQRNFDGTPFGETDIFNVRLKLDWDVTDALTVTSITGYVDMDALEFDCFSYTGAGPVNDPFGAAPTLSATDFPGAPQGMGCSSPDNRLKQFSQEIRLTSNFEGPFNFMIGGFYEDREIFFGGHQQAVNISIIAPDPVTGHTVDWYRFQVTDARAISLFASGTYDITDRLNLSGGVRWTDESKTSVIDVPFVHTFLSAGPAFIDSGFNSGDIDFDDSRWTPEVALTYSLTDTVNIFGAYKTGFKSGGVDNSALPSASLLGFGSADPAVRQATADNLIFQSETAKGGEIGVKSVIAGGALRLNATVFRYVFKNLQVQNFLADIVQFQTLNASEVRSMGLEVDWNWTTPVEGLILSGAAAYLDSQYTAPFVTGAGQDIEGRDVGRAPNFSGNIAADWNKEISTDLVLGINGNVSYSDSYFTNEDSLNDFIQDSFFNVDLAVSVSAPEAGWRVALIASNLTDKVWTNTTGGRPFLQPGVGDDFVRTQNRGRQVFIEARFNY